MLIRSICCCCCFGISRARFLSLSLSVCRSFASFPSCFFICIQRCVRYHFLCFDSPFHTMTQFLFCIDEQAILLANQMSNLMEVNARTSTSTGKALSRMGACKRDDDEMKKSCLFYCALHFQIKAKHWCLCVCVGIRSVHHAIVYVNFMHWRSV